MSSENVEIVRRCYRVFEERDWSAVPDLFDPDVEINLSRNVFNQDVFRGHAGLQQWANAVDEVWEYLVGVPTELVDADDKVAAAVAVQGKGKGSGVEVKMELFSVWTLRESKVVRVELGYRDRSDALEAVGLSDREAHAES